MKTIFVLLLTTICISISDAATYYVKPSGNDANSGLSEGLAWQHVQKACTTLVAGDTCFIRSGTYDELSASSYNNDATFNAGMYPTHSGTAIDRIVFKGYPGDVRPIIVGHNYDHATPGTAANTGGYGLTARDYIVFDSLHFRHGIKGILIGGTGNTVRYCKIDSCLERNGYNGSGIGFFSESARPNNFLAEYNDISYVGEAGNYTTVHNSAGFMVYVCDSCEFRYNELYYSGFGFRAKNVGGSQDSLAIHHNTIHDVAFHGVGLSVNATQVHVHHNTIWGYVEGAVGPTLSSGTSQRIWIYNNTFDAGGTLGGITASTDATGVGWDSVQCFNNVFYRTANGGFQTRGIWMGSGVPSRFYEDYNLYYSTANSTYFNWGGTTYNLTTWRAATPTNVIVPHGQNSTEGNPLFTDPTNHNYTPQPGSPALTGGRGGAWPSYRGAIGTIDSVTSISGATPVVEGQQLSFVVSRTWISGPVTVTYNTYDGTATSPVDYIGVTNGQLTIPSGFSSGVIFISTNVDAIAEPTQTMGVHLSSANVGTIGTADGNGSIIDGTTPPSATNEKKLKLKKN